LVALIDTGTGNHVSANIAVGSIARIIVAVVDSIQVVVAAACGGTPISL
jgi:hypothetical protein